MPKMKRYMIEARFAVRARTRDGAEKYAKKLLGDMVSEQHEEVLEVGYPEEDTGWVDPNPEPNAGSS